MENVKNADMINVLLHLNFIILIEAKKFQILVKLKLLPGKILKQNLINVYCYVTDVIGKLKMVV